MFYITNKFDYFFQLNESEVDLEKFKDCKFYNTLEEMQKYIMKVQELSFDEVDGQEMEVNKLGICDFRGIFTYFDEEDEYNYSDMYDCINNYEM